MLKEVTPRQNKEYLTQVLLSFCVRRTAVPKHSFGYSDQTVGPIDFKFCGMIDRGKAHPSNAPFTSCNQITRITTRVKSCDNYCFSQVMKNNHFWGTETGGKEGMKRKEEKKGGKGKKGRREEKRKRRKKEREREREKSLAYF